MSTENQKQLLLDTFIASGRKFSIYEATKEDYKRSGLVDGVNILGRVVGPFFAVDGASRNGRFYSRELWEKAIKNNTDRIANGMMLGTIGHEVKLDDEGLKDGNASHKVTKLQVVGNEGMGEILILNSKAGKELNALLRGGVKLAVSSRAEGTFDGKTSDGLDIVDADTYQLSGFDFVQEPGIASAYPTLVESQSTTERLDDRNKGVTMTDTVNESFKELLESATRAKVKLESDVVNLTESLTEAHSQITSLQEALKSSEAKNTSLESDLTKSTERQKALAGKLSESNKAYSQYKTLGTVDELRKALESANSMISEYQALGSPKKIREALTKAHETLEAYASNGTVSEVSKATDLLETYVKLGSIKQIQERLSKFYSYNKVFGDPKAASSVSEELESYRKVGTLKELDHACSMLEQYGKIGTLVELRQLIEATKKTISTAESRKTNSIAEKLATKYNADRKVALELVEGLGEEKADQMLKRLTGIAETASRYSVKDQPRATQTKVSESGIGRTPQKSSSAQFTVRSTKLNENAGKSVVQESRVAGLMRAFSK